MPRIKWTPEERLIAEQAVALHREVMAAMHDAPFGQGLAVTEAAVMEGGGEFLRNLLKQTLSAHPGAQKKGPAPNPALAATPAASNATCQKR